MGLGSSFATSPRARSSSGATPGAAGSRWASVLPLLLVLRFGTWPPNVVAGDCSYSVIRVGKMSKALTVAGLVAVLQGCAAPASAWKGEVPWPDEHSSRTVVERMEAGAALAAAGAIREVVRTNPFPNLFAGCSSPEQGLDVSVFAGPTPGLYFVAVDQRFDRCDGPSGRVLDWWEVYAVTAQGEVVAKAPIPTSEEPPASPPQMPPHPVEPARDTGTASPARTPPVAPAQSPSPDALSSPVPPIQDGSEPVPPNSVPYQAE